MSTSEPNATWYTIVRRQDRQITDEAWVEEALRNAPFATLAFIAESLPYAQGNTFVYEPDRKVVYFHSAKEGHLRSAIERNPAVCMTIADIGRLLPAKTATGLSTEYWSVMLFGRVRIIEDIPRATEMMRLLCGKYFPHLREGQELRPITPDEIQNITAYELVIETWTAKRKKEAPDFPGAFRFGQPPTGG